MTGGSIVFATLAANEAYGKKPMVRKLVHIILFAVFLTGCTGPPTQKNGTVEEPSSVSPAGQGPERAAETTSSTPGAANVLFIVDSSGSMKAMAGNKTRMETAKEVVNQLIGEIPSKTKVGLMAYGHRRSKDCKDIEMLLPVGPVDVEAFRSKVNSLTPVGETPISASIRQGADILAAAKGYKTIVLISDGEESCQEDACAVAAALKRANAEFTIHVVGFGLENAAAKGQLECIAKATGGLYSEASDSSELKKALDGIAKYEGDKGNLVIESRDSRGQRIFWCVNVFPAGTTSVSERVFEKCNEKDASENTFFLPSGRFDVHFYGTDLISLPNFQTLEIKPSTETRVTLEQSGRLFLNITDADGKPVQYVAQIKTLSETIKRGGTFYSGESREIMPGTYDVELWGGPAKVDNPKGVVIRPGQETKIDIQITK